MTLAHWIFYAALAASGAIVGAAPLIRANLRMRRAMSIYRARIERLEGYYRAVVR